MNCHNLYVHTLLKNPLVVKGGYVDIPDTPGIGYELDWDVVEKYRIEPIAKPYPYPDLLIRVSWPSGGEDFYAHGLQYWDDYIEGRRPIFSPGVNMEVVPDDGSDRWRSQYNEALKKPSWVMRDN